MSLVVEQAAKIENLRAALGDARRALGIVLLATGLNSELKGRIKTSWTKAGDALTLCNQNAIEFPVPQCQCAKCGVDMTTANAEGREDGLYCDECLTALVDQQLAQSEKPSTKKPGWIRDIGLGTDDAGD